MNLRLAKEVDIPEIKQLFQETILSVNIRDYTPAQVKCWAERGENENVWKERIEYQYFIVAEKEKQIQGFASLRPNGYFDFLFVHKDSLGKGIASLLLKNIEEYAVKNNIPQIVADASITAKDFLEKNGFEVLERQIVQIGIEMINYKVIKTL